MLEWVIFIFFYVVLFFLGAILISFLLNPGLTLEFFSELFKETIENWKKFLNK